MGRKSLKTRSQRRRHGISMLLLCIASFALFCLIIGIGCSFYDLVSADHQLQGWGEQVALRVAQKLNVNDHTGKLNNLTGHTRELVFVTRQMYDQTQADQNLADLSLLATQVVEHARSGALEVDREKDRYLSSTLACLKEELRTASSQAVNPIEICSLSASYHIDAVKLGYLKRYSSNVEPSTAVSELFLYDQQKRYLSRLRSDLYLYNAGLDLSLPAPDDDLHFKLSPLAMPVDGITDPLRLVQGESFQAFSCFDDRHTDALNLSTKAANQTVPSAVQIVSTVKIRPRVTGEIDRTVTSSDVASTTGASSFFRE